MKIYLSPSNQNANTYSYGNTNEMVQCNRIAEYAKSYLEAKGHEVKKAPQGQEMYTSINESNAWGSQLHVCVHTNAGGGSGPLVLVYSTAEANMKYATPIYNQLLAVTPTGRGYGVRVDKDLLGYGLAEIQETNAICIYIEAEFHDNADLAKWIIENVDTLGKAICDGISIALGDDTEPDNPDTPIEPDEPLPDETEGVHLRYGLYGAYFGSLYSESASLNQAQMKVNAKYIYTYLTKKGWSINAISAVLGNMENESTLNPGRWQSDSVGWYEGGYGCVQWTPTTKYFDWCSTANLDDVSEMDNNLRRIEYEVENHIQWYGTGNYSGMSFKEFSTSNESIEYLAVGFLLCYERPADQSEAVQNHRAECALEWYEYLKTLVINPYIPFNKLRKGYNFLLLNAGRRRKQWIKTASLKR